jgi:hypothetical protein
MSLSQVDTIGQEVPLSLVGKVTSTCSYARTYLPKHRSLATWSPARGKYPMAGRDSDWESRVCHHAWKYSSKINARIGHDAISERGQ